jgi:tetratricopeptide (TPR) repeat protein
MYSTIFRLVSTELKLDTTAVIEWGERRIKDCPDDADAYNDLVWQIYQYRPDRLDVALEYMKKAIEVAKPYQKKYVLDTMGWIYFKKAMYPEALSASEEANKLYDDPDADVIFHLGATQGKNGKIDDALQTLALSLSLQENAKVRTYFDDFYKEKFGNTEGVEEYLKKTILGKAVVDPPFAAPDFKLTSMDGRDIGLSDFKDKVILVAFWKPT